MTHNNYSDYIVYCDESGDHNLSIINPDYPIFVLVFCIFNKQDYIQQIIPTFSNLKFTFFGHDMVIFHEHEIRKAKNAFKILIDADTRKSFMHMTNQLIEGTPFTVVTVVIRKELLKTKYVEPNNPYHIALGYGLERIYSYLKLHNEHKKITHIITECRGKKEDMELELEFYQVCAGHNRWGHLPFQLIFADKKSNSCGLQFADIIAHPIGRHILNPKQENRAYNIIEKKFYCDVKGNKLGRGLKCFP